MSGEDVCSYCDAHLFHMGAVTSCARSPSVYKVELTGCAEVGFLSENLCNTSFYVITQRCTPFHIALIDDQMSKFFHTQVKVGNKISFYLWP